MKEQEKKVLGLWVVPETMRPSKMIVGESAVLKAPEGKNLTMTVNHVGTAIKPGVYEGDIVLTITDDFWRRSLRFGIPTDTNYRMGVCVQNGSYVPERSVSDIVQNGRMDEHGMSGATIISNEWDFNGIYVAGDGEYTVRDSRIELTGDGTDDFVGLGAGIAASDNARVTIERTEIHTKGVTRGAVFAGGNSVVTMNDCELSLESYVPTQEQMEAGKKLERMMEPPWSMGIRGNGRTTNLAERGVMNFNRCHVTSNSWGVLSVDGAQVNRMYVKDSLIELNGQSGYGCFSIADDLFYDYAGFGDMGCFDVFDHSVVRVPTYGIIMSLGTAGGEFKNGTVIESGRFGAFIFRNSGLLKVNSGTEIRSKEASFLVKGSNTRIEVDDAKLLPENNVILRLMDNDDTGMEGYPFLIPVGQEDIPVPGRDLTRADELEDVFVTLSNMEAVGDLFNSTTNLKPNTNVPPPAPDAPPPPDVGQIRGFLGDSLQGCKNLDLKLSNVKLTGKISAAKAAYQVGLTKITKENCEQLGRITETPAPAVNNGVILTLSEGTVWTVTGTCYLTALDIQSGCEIKAPEGWTIKLFVDGQARNLGTASYRGNIVLQVE